MFSPVTISLKYFFHVFKSSNGKGHGIHSPFVYRFVTEVLNDKTGYDEYKVVEKMRRKLITDNTPLPVEDYGARSADAVTSRSVSTIVRKAAKNPKFGQLLFRIARFYRPHYILELGTSLGISTAYLAAADPSSVVVTGEGNDAIATKAKSNLECAGLGNVRIVTGKFDNTLPEMVNAVPHIDLAFIDANHRREPTITYFNELLKKTNEHSILIFDDIHWSRGMEAAWTTIQQHPSVMLTVDLFFIGIVFFRPEFKVKQHFRIRF